MNSNFFCRPGTKYNHLIFVDDRRFKQVIERGTGKAAFAQINQLEIFFVRQEDFERVYCCRIENKMLVSEGCFFVAGK